MLASGIHDWPKLLHQCWEFLEPGGWLELLDVSHPFRAGDPAADNETSPFVKWGLVAGECWAMNGLDYQATTKHVERLRDIGFTDVHEEERSWPLGEWPDTKHEQQIGALVLKNFSSFLAMAGVQIVSQHPNINAQEAKAMVDDAQRDLVENCCTKRFYLTM